MRRVFVRQQLQPRLQASAGCQSVAAQIENGETLAFSAAREVGSYIVEGPSDGNPSHPLPLVIDLHGYSETAAIQADFTKLGSYGATNAFITVTPQVNEPVQHWITTPGSADQRFLIALIGHLEHTLCVDRDRVYVAGYSNGAFMASALACSDAGSIASGSHRCRDRSDVGVPPIPARSGDCVPRDGGPLCAVCGWDWAGREEAARADWKRNDRIASQLQG